MLVLVLAFFVSVLFRVGEARAQRNLTSAHRADEFDTGDPISFRGLANVQAGQIGGRRWGSGYAFRTLRCGNGEAIVGARIRRGDVLDYIQVACATPVCAGGTCQWNGFYWGPWAGNPAGGDPHPPMVCDQDEMVSGFRGRVVTFTVLDYAADIGIQCSRIQSSDGPNGPFRVTRETPTWHHPEGGLRIGNLPGNFVETEITNRIGCRPFGGANAISTGVANFVLPGKRVVQALSMYCPNTNPARPNPQCPQNLIVAQVMDQTDSFTPQWYSRGGLTAGGLVSVMQAGPAARNWTNTRVTEQVALVPGSNVCNLPNIANICGTGGLPNFTVGLAGNPLAVRLPVANTTIEVALGANVQLQNSFVDSHVVFSMGDVLATVPGNPACSIACTQTYTCGNGAQAVTYGPFRITYSFTHTTFQPTLPGLLPIPTGPARTVTRVTATKQ